jgi:hypothetical protein
MNPMYENYKVLLEYLWLFSYDLVIMLNIVQME